MSYMTPELRLVGNAQNVVLIGQSNSTVPNEKCQIADADWFQLNSDVVESW
jgi:hypothetical protein